MLRATLAWLLMCGGIAMAQPAGQQSPTCRQLVETHGFLSQAKRKCGFPGYSQDLAAAAKACIDSAGEEAARPVLEAGTRSFDTTEAKLGHPTMCEKVLHDFPTGFGP